MKQSTKLFIASLLSVLVVIMFCIAGIGELAAFFIILSALLALVTAAEFDRERQLARK